MRRVQNGENRAPVPQHSEGHPPKRSKEFVMCAPARAEAAELLKDEVTPKTEKALAGAEARFEAGDIGLSDLLMIQREVSATRLRYAGTLRSVMEAWTGLKSRH